MLIAIRNYLRRRKIVKAAIRELEERRLMREKLSARSWTETENPSPIEKWRCLSCKRGPFLGVRVRVCPFCRSKRVRGVA